MDGDKTPLKKKTSMQVKKQGSMGPEIE